MPWWIRPVALIMHAPDLQRSHLSLSRAARARCVPMALAVLLAIATSLTPATAHASSPLPAIGADLRETSVSGVSAGAYMAGQFQLAHADIVIGAGIVAGGPYGCADTGLSSWGFGLGGNPMNVSKAISVCMFGRMLAFGYPDARRLAVQARMRMARSEIGPLSAVRRARIYVFSGTEDKTVVPGVVASAVDFYRALGVPERNISFVDTLAAGHGFVSRSAEKACSWNGAPYLVDCDYDQAGAILQHLHGRLAAPSPKPQSVPARFDQTSFMLRDREAGMAATGLAYVPPGCRNGGCRVHVVFHGCNQDLESAGDIFATRTVFATWADTNRFVILYPQVTRSRANPYACWDWWGYTGRDFLTRAAPQIRAIRRMLDRLAAKP